MFDISQMALMLLVVVVKIEDYMNKQEIIKEVEALEKYFKSFPVIPTEPMKSLMRIKELVK